MTTTSIETKHGPPTYESLATPAGLVLGGQILFIVAGLLHPAHEAANDHPAVFAEYARSGNWTLIHFGQFVALALTMAGIVALFRALRTGSGRSATLARFGAASAVVTVAAYAVLQAVDGVALKQAVDAWARAVEPNRAAAFGTAEALRWLEWGVRSYQQVMQGVTLVILGAVVLSTGRLPRAIAYLAGAAGLAYAAGGLVIGSEGFSDTATAPGLLAIVLDLAWVIWLVSIVRRTRHQQAQLADVR